MAASRSPRLALSRAAHNVGDRDQEGSTLAQKHVADLHHHLQPAVTVGRGVPIQQRDTQRVLGQAQCAIVAGSLRAVCTASSIARTAESSARSTPYCIAKP